MKVEASGWFVGGKVDDVALRDGMNRLGEQGWELVSSFDTNMAQGASRYIVLLFKRPVR